MNSDSRILVVEAEYLVALELQQMLTQSGFAQVALCQSVVEATGHLDQQFDLAIVEARLGAEEVIRFCRVLEERGTRIVLLTADPAAAALFRDKRVLSKPFTHESLLEAVQAEADEGPQPPPTGAAWS